MFVWQAKLNIRKWKINNMNSHDLLEFFILNLILTTLC